MKKILIALSVLIQIALSASTNAVEIGFNDVSRSHVFSKAIMYVKDAGIVNGYDDGSFKPDKTINRAELTKIIVGATMQYNPAYDQSGMDIYSSSGIGFFDINDGAWFNPYLRQAVKSGLIQGYPDGSFRPEQEISFAEAAKIIVKGFQYKVSNDKIWFKPFVNVLDQKGSIPSSINRFTSHITRGEMAEMIYRLMEGITNKSSKKYEELENFTSSYDDDSTQNNENKSHSYGFAVEMDYEDNGYTDPDTLKFNEEIDVQQFRNNIRRWFEIYHNRGVNIIDMTPIKLEGIMLYDSPTLRSAGFDLPEEGEVLSVFMESAAKYDMKLVMQIEGIAHIVTDGKPYDPKIDANKLTVDATKSVIRELADLGKKSNIRIAINEEAFPKEYIVGIEQAVKNYNVEYMHFFWDLDCKADMYISEDYAYYPYDAKNNAEDKKYMNFLVEQGSYMGKLGDLNTMYGAAEACNTPYAVAVAGGWGMGAKTHQNIVLLRGIQFMPDFFQFIIASGENDTNLSGEEGYVQNYNFKKTLIPLLNEYGRKKDDKPKKIANIILDEENPASKDVADYFELAQMASLSPITNAFLAAGYDIRVTKSKIYPNADIYYVYSPGYIYDEGNDIPSSLANLVDGNIPVYYQVAGAIPDLPNWQKVADYLGIAGNYKAIVNEDDSSDWDPIPETVEYKFPNGTSRIKYAGYNFEVTDPDRAGGEIEGHYIHYIDPTDISATVLLEGKTAKDDDRIMNDRTALIIKKNNAFFVNGSTLHMDMSQILANIIAEDTPYQAPSYGYLTRGAVRSVFYAPYDTSIDIRLLGGTKVTVFDEEGKIISNPDIVIKDGRLKGSVKRFNLVVITK